MPYSAQVKMSSKAALLSGLICPGIGHIYLKEYSRGAGLIVLSLAALSVLATMAYQHALLIADRIISGDVSLAPGAIAQAISDSMTVTDSTVGNAASVVLVVCWLAGIIDSYRLGAVKEKSNL